MKYIVTITAALLSSLSMVSAEETGFAQSSTPTTKKNQPTQMSAMIPARFCGETEKISLLLKNEYQENLVFIGKSDGGPGLIKIYINQAQDTWTLVFSYYGGQSCIFDSGTGYRHSDLKLKD